MSKERLITLLRGFEFKCPKECLSVNYKDCNECKLEQFADYLLANGVIVPPCKVGDKFYRVESFCTEGGYWDNPRNVYSSICEDCCEECDEYKKIVEYSFNSAKQILELENYFGKTVFLTREEAEAKLKESESNGKTTM